ncbi:MAG: Cof-type HAD-IIB family hydrolase [Candidatus Cryptobacteroides sp.]
MIKALFLDVDGTIISTKTKKIPESAVVAIKKAREAGVKVFLCTSRAKQFLSNISGIDNDGIVALTGAHCIDARGNDIGCRPMEAADVASALTDVLRRDVPVVAMGPDCVYMNHPESAEVAGFLATGGLTLDDIPGGTREIPDFLSAGNPVELAERMNVMQITGFFPSGEEDRRFLSLMPSCHSERWNERFVDIVGNGISKAYGIDVMAEHFGFSVSETMGMGDGANDIPMIRHAGTGVAMGNASEEVKASADYVTGDVDDDGLSKAVMKYVFGS